MNVTPSLWLIGETDVRIQRDIESAQRHIETYVHSVAHQKGRIDFWKSLENMDFQWEIEEARKSIRNSKAVIRRREIALSKVVRLGAEEMLNLQAARERALAVCAQPFFQFADNSKSLNTRS